MALTDFIYTFMYKSASAILYPSGMLRGWEQGRKEPDAAARAYLTVIGREPEAVGRALGAGGLT